MIILTLCIGFILGLYFKFLVIGLYKNWTILKWKHAITGRWF